MLGYYQGHAVPPGGLGATRVRIVVRLCGSTFLDYDRLWHRREQVYGDRWQRRDRDRDEGYDGLRVLG